MTCHNAIRKPDTVPLVSLWRRNRALRPPHPFFYLDPPYYAIKGYRLNFETKDFEELARALTTVKGKFLMSLNDHKEVRRIFAGFKTPPVSLRYSCMREPGSHSTVRGELLISNY